MNDLKWKEECLLGIPAADLRHRRIADGSVAMAAEAGKRNDSKAATARESLSS